jgi:hypothetical protein
MIGIVVGFGALAALEAMIASRSCVSTGGRLVAAGKALVYAGLAGTAIAVALHQPVSGGNREVIDATALVMRAAGGRLLVGAAGMCLGVGGVVLFVKGAGAGGDGRRPPRLRGVLAFGGPVRNHRVRSRAPSRRLVS